MPANWGAEERRALQALLAKGETLRCPRCDAAPSRSEVPPSPKLAYVRRRVLLVCGRCGCSAAFDLAAGAG